MFTDALLSDIRARFAHVETCPITGPRIFLENAGGALTLKSVVETSGHFAAIPDNQGRDNPASRALVRVIDKARADVRLLFNATGGAVVFGESGTELLFRLIRDACVGAPAGGIVLGSTVEHPASRGGAGPPGLFGPAPPRAGPNRPGGRMFWLRMTTPRGR